MPFQSVTRAFQRVDFIGVRRSNAGIKDSGYRIIRRTSFRDKLPAR